MWRLVLKGFCRVAVQYSVVVPSRLSKRGDLAGNVSLPFSNHPTGPVDQLQVVLRYIACPWKVLKTYSMLSLVKALLYLAGRPRDSNVYDWLIAGVVQTNWLISTKIGMSRDLHRLKVWQIE